MVCECDCGNITKQRYADLKNGKVKSCGCYNIEVASINGSTIGLNNYKNNLIILLLPLCLLSLIFACEPQPS